MIDGIGSDVKVLADTLQAVRCR